MVCRCCSIDGHDLIQNIRKEEDARGPSYRKNKLQDAQDIRSLRQHSVCI